MIFEIGKTEGSHKKFLNRNVRRDQSFVAVSTKIVLCGGEAQELIVRLPQLSSTYTKLHPALTWVLQL